MNLRQFFLNQMLAAKSHTCLVALSRAHRQAPRRLIMSVLTGHTTYAPSVLPTRLSALALLSQPQQRGVLSYFLMAAGHGEGEPICSQSIIFALRLTQIPKVGITLL
jgi:hypothetical protein